MPRLIGDTAPAYGVRRVVRRAPVRGTGSGEGYVPATASTMRPILAPIDARYADAARYTAQAMSQGYFPSDVSGGLANFMYRSWTPLYSQYGNAAEAMTGLGYVPGQTHNMGYGWVTPTPQSEGGYYGEGGGGGGAPEVRWTTGNYQAAGQNVPLWWKPWVPTDRSLMEQPDVAWTVMANAMIPYLSPEDQARVANQLYTVWGKDLTPYSPETVTAGTPWEERDLAFMTGQERPDTSYFMGTQRSQDAIQTLANLIASEAGGDASKLGAGYRWLQDLLGGVTESGGGQTRQSYMQMLSNLDPILASAKSGELGAYGPLGEALARPYFTNFQLRPTTQAGTFGRERGSKFLYW